MKQKCKSVRGRLSEYLDVSPGKAVEEYGMIESHLRECVECREELKKLKKTVESVRKLPDFRAPEHLCDAVVDHLESERPGKPAIIRLWPRISAVAASFLLISAVTLMVNRGRFQPAPRRVAEEKGTEYPEDIPEAEAPPARSERVRMRSVEEDSIEIAPEMLRRETEERRDRRVAGVRKLAERPGIDLKLDEKPTLEMLGKTTEILRAAGVENVKTAIATLDEEAGFELTFDIEPEVYEKLYKELEEAFNLDSGSLPKQVTELMVSPETEEPRIETFVAERSSVHKEIEQDSEKQVEPEKEEDQPARVNITLRVRKAD